MQMALSPEQGLPSSWTLGFPRLNLTTTRSFSRRLKAMPKMRLKPSLLPLRRRWNHYLKAPRPSSEVTRRSHWPRLVVSLLLALTSEDPDAIHRSSLGRLFFESSASQSGDLSLPVSLSSSERSRLSSISGRKGSLSTQP